jgi:hypothetical protein
MYRKTIKIKMSDPSRNISCLANEIIKALGESRAKNIRIAGTKITFSVGLFQNVVGLWDLLAPITCGEIQIDAECIRYSLFFSRLIILGSLLVAVGGIAMIAEGVPVPHLLFILPFMWFWLVGGNFIIAITRFSRFIKRAVRHAGFALG